MVEERLLAAQTLLSHGPAHGEVWQLISPRFHCFQLLDLVVSSQVKEDIKVTLGKYKEKLKSLKKIAEIME